MRDHASVISWWCEFDDVVVRVEVAVDSTIMAAPTTSTPHPTSSPPPSTSPSPPPLLTAPSSVPTPFPGLAATSTRIADLVTAIQPEEKLDTGVELVSVRMWMYVYAV